MKKLNKKKIIKGSLLIISSFLFLSLINYENKLDKTLISLNEKKENTVFTYVDKVSLMNILSNETGVVILTNSKTTSNRFINLLFEVKEQYKIYVYNMKNDEIKLTLTDNNEIEIEKESSEFYNKLLDILGSYAEDYILYDKNNERIKTDYKIIYTPTVLFIKDGKIKYSHAFIDNTLEDSDLLSIYKEAIKSLKNN